MAEKCHTLREWYRCCRQQYGMDVATAAVVAFVNWYSELR